MIDMPDFSMPKPEIIPIEIHKAPKSVQDHYEVLQEAMDIYRERHARRGDQFKQYGWRGALFNVRICAERAWRAWFNRPTRHEGARDQLDVDELLDCINYAAMAIREIRAGNRDGLGNWWGDKDA